MRNEQGLIQNVEYVYDDSGFVNWRQMIKPEFLYPNKGWFEVRGLKIPTSIEGLEDHQLTIKLAGIKELLKLRGFINCDTDTDLVDKEYVKAKCTIVFLPNFETENREVRFSANANATVDNTNGFGVKFLETIAENRAFVRCVRNFLNIHIVGDDEIDKSSPKTEEIVEEKLNKFSTHDVLEKIAKGNGCLTFDDFLTKLRVFWKDGSYKNSEAKNWKSYKDIPAKECRKLMAIFESKQEASAVTDE